MDKRKEIIKYRFADPKKAYDICCDLLEESVQSGNDYEIAYAYLYMGDTLFSMGKLDDARMYLEMSEEIDKKNGFDNLLMRAYNIIGIIYVNMSDAMLALDYYHRALILAKKHNNYTLTGMIYNNVGYLFQNAGDAEKAVEYYRLAYKYCLKKSENDNDNDLNPDTIQVHLNICDAYIREKRYSEAKIYIDDLLNMIDKNKLQDEDKMRIMHVYAMIYFYANEYVKAYDICKKAAHIAAGRLEDVESFDDYCDFADIMIHMGKIEHVHELIMILDSMAEKTDLDSMRLKVCRIYIGLFLKSGRNDKLNEQLRRYYQLKKKINEERNNIIISAIDNRCRLEDERKKNKQLNEDNMKLVKESEIDELTGIYNRLAFRRRYDRLYRYALRNNHAYCMGIFDIDYFKVYNDSYGHIKGDQCLKQVAQILRRTSDGDFCVARYGGDEFVFMAYDVSEDKVRDFLRRLVENIRNAAITFDKKPDTDTDSVTISIGAVIQNRATEGMELAELLKQADRVLYEVKQSGKDGYKLRIE